MFFVDDVYDDDEVDTIGDVKLMTKNVDAVQIVLFSIIVGRP